MGGATPKQYLPLGGRTVIDHALERLLQHPSIAGVVVVLGAQDEWWPTTAFASHPAVMRAAGGVERCHSVRNGLGELGGRAAEHDWVLVHDAARPCLRPEDLERLISGVSEHPVGGLLGVPVRDTMKRTDASGGVRETVPREHLWHAFTPQMFRLGVLRDALDLALDQDHEVTDEASAMEFAGHRPLMIEGHADNLKVTRPEDLALAGFYLSQQEQSNVDRSRV
jgi:2-C-methyl-D-erythritol 4-phosphate cytidylyltransferase